MKVYVTYTWYGGGGFDGFYRFGPVFTRKEDADRWEQENEGEYHTGYDELEAYDNYVKFPDYQNTITQDGKP